MKITTPRSSTWLSVTLALLCCHFSTGCVSPQPIGSSNQRLQAPQELLAENTQKALRKASFDWPVDQARLTRGFFLKDPRGKRRKPHYGIDLAAPRGTPIYASHPGRVIFVGKRVRGYGRMVMVESPKGYASLYAHLNKAHVKMGDMVKVGDLIAEMGNTGRSTGPHLHFEIRTHQGPVDPLIFLPTAAVGENRQLVKLTPPDQWVSDDDEPLHTF